MPVLSVVVPARNEEQRISGTLASLRRQVLEETFEIIVVDNGSTDGTAQAAREGGAQVIFQALAGVAYARQAGLEAATGTIVVQADADTEYPPDWLARIIRTFKEHPEAIAVAGGFQYRTPRSFEHAEWAIRNFANRMSKCITGRLLMVSGANFSFYRHALLACGGYHQAAFSCDQYDIAARLSRLGDVVYDDDLRVTTSARRVQRSPPVIAMIFMRFVLGLHLNIFRFFFYGQSQEWLTVFGPRLRKTISVSVTLIVIILFSVLIWCIYFSIFK